MSKLFYERPKRFFAFGCSYTSYGWPTWADLVSIELGPSTKYYNFARSGAGNQYIANTIAQADAKYNFDKNDLVIVCWTNVAREDRMFKKADGNAHWEVPGNIHNQEFYSKEWIDEYANCPEYFYLRDFATIHLTTGLLKKTVSHQLCMIDLHNSWDQYMENDSPVAEENIGTMAFPSHTRKVMPSFYKVLWNNKLKTKMLNDMKYIHRYYLDMHPTPEEHFRYLKTVFRKHKWSKSTLLTAKAMHLEFITIMKQLYEEHNIQQPTLPFVLLQAQPGTKLVDNFDNLKSKYSIHHDAQGIIR